MAKLPTSRRWLFGGLVAAALALRLSFFCISVTHLQPSSDESISILQAKSITGGDFPLLFTAQPYLFPVESYMIAPFAVLLPQSALGARLVPFLMGLATTLVSLIILYRCFQTEQTPWAGAILILFPSSYFLMMQAGCALPGYSALPLLGALGILAAFKARETEGKPVVFAFLSGAIAGLMFSSHMLALPFAVITAASVCLGVNWRSAVRNSASFAPGLLLGLAPYVAAKRIMPGAHEVAAATRPAGEALGRLWSPALKYTLTTALGARTCLFPDGDSLNLSRVPAQFFGAAWSLILISCLLIAAFSALRRAFRQKWPSIHPREMFTGIAVLTLIAFVFGVRADSRSYRYFLPLVWSFPFLLAYLHSKMARPIRPVILAAALLMAGWNVYASVDLMTRWVEKDFPAREAGVADLEPALEFLKRNDIRHCVASYGAAYRINFMSNGRVTASQPFNERFPGWPIPYKQEVDRATDTAYVLTDTIRFLTPKVFDRHLDTMKITGRKTTRGDFSIYYDFEEMEPQSESVVPGGMLTFTASHNPGSAQRMNDGILDNRWTTDCLQRGDMWVQADIQSPLPVSKLRLYYGKYYHDRAPGKDVLALVDGEWETIVTDNDDYLDKFIFENGHPVYGNASRTIRMPETVTSAIRLRVTEPNPRFSWTIAEMHLFTPQGKAAQ